MNDPQQRPMRVGFVGVGKMGRPMVDRLHQAGWPLEVSVRRAELREELEAMGVGVASSPADLASRSDLLIICLFDDAQAREVVLDGGVLAAMPPGSVLVNHVTGSPVLATTLWSAAPVDVGVLDVPISGTEDSIRAGQLTLLVGGDPVLLDRVREPLASYGDPILHVGDVGDAQRHKLINNLLLTVHVHIALHAARLAAELGIEPTELARVVSQCSGSSFALELFRQREPEALASSTKRYLAKDVAVVRDVATSIGIDLGVLGDLAGWVDD